MAERANVASFEYLDTVADVEKWRLGQPLVRERGHRETSWWERRFRTRCSAAVRVHWRRSGCSLR